MKGYVHVYTGDGKGKTTAAFGLALRAVGAGKKVFIAQFIKGMSYSEIDAVKQFFPSITVTQYGRDCFIKNAPTGPDIDCARRGLTGVREILRSGIYDMVVLDEACIAIHYQLFTVDELIKVIEERPAQAEIVITGRYAPPDLIVYADLVTEMKEIRHYFIEGVQARRGIEY